MQNLSNENVFDLHENELRGGTHFHMNAFEQRLVFIQRQKATRKCLLRIQLSQKLNGLKGQKSAERCQGSGVLTSYYRMFLRFSFFQLYFFVRLCYQPQALIITFFLKLTADHVLCF